MVEIKGSVILDSITGIKKRDGAQAYEELVALLDEDTKRMFQGVISGSSWYSLELFLRFLALSPQAQEYYQQLEQRRLNPKHHVQKIVALSELYGTDAVARALADAFTYQAFSCEYIANLLAQRQHPPQEPGALHLTRQADLLELELPAPDLSLYDPPAPPQSPEHP